MEIKTDIIVTVYYNDDLKGYQMYNFNDVNKAASFQLQVLNAENVRSATLEMNMFKSEVLNG